MLQSLLRRLALSSLLAVCFMAQAQGYYPTQDTVTVRCQAMIEMDKGYMSGVCILKRDGNVVHGSVFNEFGISAMSFTFDEARGKVKLHSIISMLDKWYIRRTIKGDIARWMKELQAGGDTYVNQRRHITYRLSPLAQETTVEEDETQE